MKNKYIVEVLLDNVYDGDVKHETKTYKVKSYYVGDGVLTLDPLNADGKLVERIYIPLCKIYNISVKRIDGSAEIQ